MPDRIARLPQDRRGFPVPWVSCWSSATAMAPNLLEVPVTIQGHSGVAIFGAATCDHVAGDGEPDLANLCVANQIRGMLLRLCDVCGEHVPGNAHFVGSISNTSFRETPLHIECAVYSLQVCPGVATAPGIGVQTCVVYETSPTFLMPGEGSGKGTLGRGELPEGVVEKDFVSVAVACAYMQVTKNPGVCIGVRALPVDPVVRTREAFLEEFR